MTCEVVSNTADADHRVYLPVCAWADSATVAVVSRTDYADLAATASKVDLRAFASLAATVREEISG